MLEVSRENTLMGLDTPETLERFFWEALEIDSLDRKIESGDYAPTRPLLMGTGKTENACQMCNSSISTHQKCNC